MPNLHHFLQNTALPYISNANVTETRPYWINGSNVMSSLKGYVEKRPGFPTYTTDVFAQPVMRLFGWRLWGGAFFVMANTVGGGQSIVWKLKVGTDVTFSSIFTSAVATVFDFATSNNQLYFGNGTDMQKYDGTTVTKWGIAKPAAAPGTASGAGAISAAAGGYSWRYAFGNSGTTHIGAISDVSAYTGNFTSKNYTITGSTTSDGQVNQVHIYRTADGGATYYELPNSPIAYVGGWSVVDSALSTALNISAQASIPALNNPPLAAQGCVFFAGRIWTFAGDKLYYSNFEETINGISAEQFNNINIYAFGTEITGLATCQRSLLIFTRNSIQRITGDSIATFSRQPFLNRVGVHQQANIAQGGQRLVAWLDISGTVIVTDGITSQEIGLPIRKDLAGIDQTKASVAFHSNGIQQWLVVQDSGQNKSWTYDNDNGQWMVPWSIGGTAMTSVETASGVYTMLRSTSSGTQVLKLNTAVYQDAGTSYFEFLMSGLVNLGEGKGPGEVGTIEYLALERNTVANNDVQTILDDNPLTGSFTSFFANEIAPPDRTDGSALIERWYYVRTGTARRGAFQLIWPTGTSAWQLYTVDLVSNQMEEIGAG